MNKLIYSTDNSIQPSGAIGKQTFGLIFWQKTGFLRRCNELGLKAIVSMINKKYAPSSIQIQGNNYFLCFDNDERKIVFLTLKRELNSSHQFIYGEAHTAYVDADFHLLVLDMISFIAKQIGSKFFVDDATKYLVHYSRQRLEEYIAKLDVTPVISDDLLRKNANDS